MEVSMETVANESFRLQSSTFRCGKPTRRESNADLARKSIDGLEYLPSRLLIRSISMPRRASTNPMR